MTCEEALKHILGSGAMKQRDIAEKAGSASQTINAIVRGRKVAGLQKQEEIAVACGYEYVDFLLLGRRILGGTAPATAEGEMSRESALMAVTALVDQMMAAEENGFLADCNCNSYESRQEKLNSVSFLYGDHRHRHIDFCSRTITIQCIH